MGGACERLHYARPYAALRLWDCWRYACTFAHTTALMDGRACGGAIAWEVADYAQQRRTLQLYLEAMLLPHRLHRCIEDWLDCLDGTAAANW